MTQIRANNGRVGAFEGTELVLLTTTGTKSGEPRLSPLSSRRVDGKLLIIAGYGGPALGHRLGPLRVSLVAKRFRCVAVVIPEVRVSGGITPSLGQ
jgi:hypothetical protein